jgi:OFA family oxalate/formate antiporter-like MFS transporter
MSARTKVPTRAWIVTFAGMAINLCLGILYAWSVWSASLIYSPSKEELTKGVQELREVIKKDVVPDDLKVLKEGYTKANDEGKTKLLNEHYTKIRVQEMAGKPRDAQDPDGWKWLTNAQASWPYGICVILFAIFMIPGGRIQDKISPRFGATIGGLFLASGCILAGLMKSYTGLLIGFGILGGIGMGIGYAAPTPAALKWFGPHKRGLIAGIVVGGYGGAALYISPLGNWLMDKYGISGSFIGLGIIFAVVVIIAAQFLIVPREGYVPPMPPEAANKKTVTAHSEDWSPKEMLKSWQFYALVLLFIGSTQSGFLIISNATGLLKTTAFAIPFFAMHAWILASYGGLVNASGRINTGLYSDKIGRANAYTINGIVSAICLALMPAIMASKSIVLLFIAVGIAYWQYGGGLSLLPSYTADFYGSKNLGVNYGLVFLGWGFGFFMPTLAGKIKDLTGSLDLSFYISAVILVIVVILSRVTKKPVKKAKQST